MAGKGTDGRTRRRWSAARKAAIVGELHQPGATLSSVARRHALSPGITIQRGFCCHGIFRHFTARRSWQREGPSRVNYAGSLSPHAGGDLSEAPEVECSATSTLALGENLARCNFHQVVPGTRYAGLGPRLPVWPALEPRRLPVLMQSLGAGLLKGA